jgi:hypothetical protein
MKVSVKMETKRRKNKSNNNDSRGIRRKLPIYTESCSFEGYNPSSLMAETAKLRNLITKRGMLYDYCWDGSKLYLRNESQCRT